MHEDEIDRKLENLLLRMHGLPITVQAENHALIELIAVPADIFIRDHDDYCNTLRSMEDSVSALEREIWNGSRLESSDGWVFKVTSCGTYSRAIHKDPNYVRLSPKRKWWKHLFCCK